MSKFNDNIDYNNEIYTTIIETKPIDKKEYNKFLIESFTKVMNKILKKEGYKYKRFLGKGYSGLVNEYSYLDGKTYAIKGIFPDKKEDPFINNIIHKNAKKKCKDNSNFLLHGKFVKYKDIYFFISESLESDLKIFKENQKLNSLTRRFIVCQLIYGLYCLHKLGITHGDIKPKNIFVKKHKKKQLTIVKIGDFDGAAYKNSNRTVKLWTSSYAPYYKSSPSKLNQLDDVYSMGISILYMYCSKDDFERFLDEKSYIKYSSDRKRQIKHFLKLQLKLIKRIKDKPVRDLLKKMLTLNPNYRPKSKKLYNLPYIKQFCKNVIEELNDYYKN